MNPAMQRAQYIVDLIERGFYQIRQQGGTLSYIAVCPGAKQEVLDAIGLLEKHGEYPFNQLVIREEEDIEPGGVTFHCRGK